MMFFFDAFLRAASTSQTCRLCSEQVVTRWGTQQELHLRKAFTILESLASACEAGVQVRLPHATRDENPPADKP